MEEEVEKSGGGGRNEDNEITTPLFFEFPNKERERNEQGLKT